MDYLVEAVAREVWVVEAGEGWLALAAPPDQAQAILQALAGVEAGRGRLWASIVAPWRKSGAMNAQMVALLVGILLAVGVGLMLQAALGLAWGALLALLLAHAFGPPEVSSGRLSRRRRDNLLAAAMSLDKAGKIALPFA